MDDLLTAVVTALDGRKDSGQWRCRCPIHGGRSLLVKQGRERLLVRCMGGCDTGTVIAELQSMGLWPKGKPRREYGPPTEADLQAARMQVIRAVFLRNLDKQAGAEPRPFPAVLVDAARVLSRSSSRDDWTLAKIVREEVPHVRAA